MPDKPKVGSALAAVAQGFSPVSAAAIYLLISLIFTWPLVRHPASRVVGHVIREATPPLNTWAMAVVPPHES